MKKVKVKKRRTYWLVYTDRKNVAKCYSIEAAQLWRDVLGREDKKCTS